MLLGSFLAYLGFGEEVRGEEGSEDLGLVRVGVVHDRGYACLEERKRFNRGTIFTHLAESLER